MHFFNETADCFHCHITPELFAHPSKRLMNNGMDYEDDFVDMGVGAITGNPNDNAKFKIPSLRNLPMKGPFMHDGRFETIEDVIDFYNEGPKISPSLEPIMIAEARRRVLESNHWGLNMTAQEKFEVVEFLKSLNDTTYLSDPHYLAPKGL